MKAQNNELSLKHEKIIAISAYTAQGNLEKLVPQLNEALDAGLTLNEVKETLVHLYAYCGFPRSLQGINILKNVVEERKNRGISDTLGRDATPITDSRKKYERGKENQVQVTGQTAEQLRNGVAFTPIMDTFLTEHLFADIFERDILNNVITSNNKQIKTENMEAKTIFPKGEKNTIPYFTGTSYLQMLMTNEKNFDCSIGNVTFEKACRNNWHSHPGGQLLLVTNGEGYYQEKGKPIQLIKAGDVIEILPNIVHWHGATADSEMTHIAISIKVSLGAAVWGDPVTDAEYDNYKK